MDTGNKNAHNIEALLAQEFVSKINKVAIDAGLKILDIYQRDFNIEIKDDQSPLTEADLASHIYIVSQLEELTPNIPILSEESADISWNERSQWDTYWLIDPLDGTKEFIKKNGEFTVNIALIHKGRSVLGVVYAPVLELLYFASSKIGAWKQEKKSDPMGIKVSGSIDNKVVKIMGSRSHQSDDFKEYVEQFNQTEIVSMGSSLKLCYVAEGKADIYPRLGLTSEWDTAAAHAVVSFAGGECLNHETGLELTYNTKDSLLNPYFIVKGF